MVPSSVQSCLCIYVLFKTIFFSMLNSVWVYWPACGSIHCAMTSRNFSSATLESSPPFSGSWMKKPSLGLGLKHQKHTIQTHISWKSITNTRISWDEWDTKYLVTEHTEWYIAEGRQIELSYPSLSYFTVKICATFPNTTERMTHNMQFLLSTTAIIP